MLDHDIRGPVRNIQWDHRCVETTVVSNTIERISLKMSSVISYSLFVIKLWWLWNKEQRDFSAAASKITKCYNKAYNHSL